MDNRVHWLWLAQVLGPDARLGPVLEQYGTAQAVYENRKDALSDRMLFSAAMHARMRDTTLEECEERLYAVLSSGYGVLCREDETFPERLKAFDTCPPVLYYMGDTALLDGFLNIGCVGSRRPQALFRNLTLRVCRSLAAAGVTLFSGFAAGIDADVHRAAYSADRGSVAVLPCGIDVAYPAENRGLRRMVVKKGLLLSQFAPGLPAYREHFRPRNRLLCMLCDGVLVSQAALKSGSLMSGHLAMECGAEVFSFPDRIGNPATAGNLQLLREGAVLCTGPQDLVLPFRDRYAGLHEEEQIDRMIETGPGILKDTPDRYVEQLPEPSEKGAEPAHDGAPLPARLESVYRALEDGPVHIEQLAAKLSMPAGTLMAALTELELLGAVQSLPGKQYVRKGSKP